MMSRERVIPVPPTSTRKILERAYEFLDEFEPDRIHAPGILDYDKLINVELPRKKIDVYPVEPDEIPGAEGQTSVSRDAPARLEILILDDYYEALSFQNSSTVRARSTIIHEVGHAVLHGPLLRRMEKLGPKARKDILHQIMQNVPAYRHPEWQAWMFTGALLMPPSALSTMRGCSAREIADEFGTSVEMVKSHINRLRRFGFQLRRGILVVGLRDSTGSTTSSYSGLRLKVFHTR